MRELSLHILDIVQTPSRQSLTTEILVEESPIKTCNYSNHRYLGMLPQLGGYRY